MQIVMHNAGQGAGDVGSFLHAVKVVDADADRFGGFDGGGVGDQGGDSALFIGR